MPTKTEEYARPATPPDSPSLTTVREAAENCTACHLYKRATQTVFGEGPKKPAMMLVGEQPGDYEDVAGKPFVGPAGKIMDRALEEAGIDRKEVYVTNAVKHFKWESRRKRRIHQNQTHARSPLVARGLKWSCDSLGRNCLSFSARPPVRRSSGLRFESRASSGRFFLQSSRPKSWLRSILRRCCGSQMKNRAIANTKTSSPIFGLRLKPQGPSRSCPCLKTSVSSTLLAPGSQFSFLSVQALQILPPKCRLGFSNKRRSLLHYQQCPSLFRPPRLS